MSTRPFKAVTLVTTGGTTKTVFDKLVSSASSSTRRKFALRSRRVYAFSKICSQAAYGFIYLAMAILLLRG